MSSAEDAQRSEEDAPELLVIVGPTGSGKTELSLRLAEELDGEIVSCDSVQVYRHFDLGSAKPTASERERAPHHLIDVADPEEHYEAQRFVEQARAAIAAIHARGKRALLVGGTFLWVRALLYGLAEAPAADPEIRERHRIWAEREGRSALHRELARIDPKSALRLHENDLIRVSRALEVFELSGRTLSEIQEAHGFRTRHYRATLFGLGWDRDAYDRRLLERTRKMFEQGWLDEVRALLDRGYGDTRAMSAVGYRQIQEALRADAPLDTEALIEEIYRVTRVFARRQRTWLREEPVEWLEPSLLGGAAPLRAQLSRLLG